MKLIHIILLKLKIDKCVIKLHILLKNIDLFIIQN